MTDKPEMLTSKTSPFELVCIWLESALRCKYFAWDADQHAAAMECLESAREQLKANTDEKPAAPVDYQCRKCGSSDVIPWPRAELNGDER